MIAIPPSIVDSWPAPAANPETRGPALPIVVLTFYTLAGIVVSGVTIAVLLSKWEYLLDRTDMHGIYCHRCIVRLACWPLSPSLFSVRRRLWRECHFLPSIDVSYSISI
ncbi:hypothetical protein BDW71DRAFT_181746 [Aspergillus fruticulosus]